MRRSHYIYLFICFIGVLGIYQLSHPTVSSKNNNSIDSSSIDEDLTNHRITTSTDDPPRSNDKAHLEICRRGNKIRGTYLQPPSPNSHKTSIISNSNDYSDIVLCKGDVFGDLDGTYLTVQDCNLAMYHQGNLIWSSNKLARLANDDDDENMLCAVSLQRDGNLVVYKESMTCFYPIGQRPVIWSAWDSKTDFHPSKTELRIQDQQLQMIHTLQDGSERIFYAGEDHRGFREDFGAPRQIAKESLIVNHNDTNNSVIMRRNEYIGDLSNTHLIFQSNCELQLKDKNKTIWSFAAYLKPDGDCTLNVQGSSIGIPKLPGGDYQYEGMNILSLIDFTVLQSNITFFGDQLFIIQTLKNGSEVTFYSEPGQDNGLKLQRKGKQIAPNNNTISSQTTLQRMDYIGNLDGLHMILRDNCILTLMNGQEELWRSIVDDDRPWRSRESLEGPFMECHVQFNEDGTIMFSRIKNNNQRNGEVQIFGKKSYRRGDHPSEFQLSLVNNMMIMTLQYQNNPSEIYHGNANTNGTWFQFVSGRSVIFKASDNIENILIPEMSYIGDINGVFVILDKKANLILYNKTKVIWESRTTQENALDFAIILTKDGDLAITYNLKWAVNESKNYLWCTQTSKAYKQAKLKTSELLVDNDGLWLINTYVDGVVMRFKALEGTDTFTLVSNENESKLSPPPNQIYKL